MLFIDASSFIKNLSILLTNWSSLLARLLCLGSVAEKVGRTVTRGALEDLLNGCSHLEVCNNVFLSLCSVEVAYC